MVYASEEATSVDAAGGEWDSRMFSLQRDMVTDLQQHTAADSGDYNRTETWV